MTEDELTAHAAVLQNAATALETEAVRLEQVVTQMESILKVLDTRRARSDLYQIRQVTQATKQAMLHHFDQQAIAQIEERARITQGKQAWEQSEQEAARIMRTNAQKEFRP